jgi:hypothetical protein
MVMPRAFAVARFSTNSNLVGCSIGRFGALEDLVHIGRGSSYEIKPAGSIGHQAADREVKPRIALIRGGVGRTHEDHTVGSS